MDANDLIRFMSENARYGICQESRDWILTFTGQLDLAAMFAALPYERADWVSVIAETVALQVLFDMNLWNEMCDFGSTFARQRFDAIREIPVTQEAERSAAIEPLWTAWRNEFWQRYGALMVKAIEGNR